MRGELGEVLGRRVREDDALAGEAREADVRERGERLAALAHPLDRAQRRLEAGAVVRADRGDVELARALRPPRSAETPPSVCASSSKVSSATIGSAETPRTASIAVDELVEVVERLDHEEVDAAALEELRLLGEDARRGPSTGAAERADRAGDEDVRARTPRARRARSSPRTR